MSSTNPYQTPAAELGVTPIPEGSLASALRTTRTGLMCAYYGICAILLGVIGGAVLSGVAAAMQVGALALIGGGMLLITVICGPIAILVGQFFCLSAPEEVGARGFVIGSIVTQGISFLLGLASVFGFALLAFITVPVSGSVFSFVNFSLGVLSQILFLVALQRIARHIGRNDLAWSAKITIGLLVAAFLCWVTSMMLIASSLATSNATPGSTPTLAFGGVLLFGGILFLVAFLKYANLLIYLAKAIPLSSAETEVTP